MPTYAGIETLRETGDAIQVGGARLCEGGVFPTRRRQGALQRRSCRTALDVPDGRFLLSTRRGKQFNSMVWDDATRSPAPGATRCSWPRPTPARSASRTGDAVLVRIAAR